MLQIKLNHIKYGIERLVLFIFLFLYIYSIQFFFIPFGIGSRVVLALFGIGVYFIKQYPHLVKGKFPINKKTYSIGIFLIMISVVSILSLIFNNTQDLSFVKYPVSIILIMFGAYFIAYIFRNIYHEITFKLIADYVIAAVLFQVLLAVILFLFPFFKSSLFSLLSLSDLDNMLINETGEFRLIGFGSYFFGAGITNSFVLILIAILLKTMKFDFRIFFSYMACFLLILCIGIMMSRTTIVGGAISLLIAFYKSNLSRFKIGIKVRNITRSFIIFALIIISIVWILPSNIKDNLQIALNFGFELVINYIEHGELESASTDRLKEMYDVYPQSFKTYVIGDGHYTDPQNPASYYKHIDIGYLRLIYYFGVVGMLTFFLFQLKVIYTINKLFENKYASFFGGAILILLILNLKGFTDIFFLIYLFYFAKPNPEKIALTKYTYNE